MPTAERGQRSQYSLYSTIPNQYKPLLLTFPLNTEIETGTLDTSLKIELPESYCIFFHIVLFEDMDERSQEKEMVEQVVRVKRKNLEACMTCPLCNHLLNEATTISLCLHTFCRKCIYKKLTHEKVDCCPICNMHLGRLPTEKLRPDNYLQDMRAKIFPFKRREVKAFEVMPSVALPKKRKGEQRERARDLQTSRADDLVPRVRGQDDGESLGSQMFTAYSISLEEELQDSKVIPESEESIRDLGLVPHVASQSGKGSLALPNEVSDIPTTTEPHKNGSSSNSEAFNTTPLASNSPIAGSNALINTYFSHSPFCII
ncbi:PREDICTED: E3 ubiquitin protein ligase DRIP2-like isoform X3 [Populus euphratica]|uniref:E3 ubiquitin protein ligase DRIP2-like isoform X3 n=1 Tax=Populus euphratica TaxID=75702 RepID=A0AAJ6XV40_POPEU|nr:PREDICTED: E3 ubiquitin protein ligase DRIP2-like isoform X3 [Populus euphratica]